MVQLAEVLKANIQIGLKIEEIIKTDTKTANNIIFTDFCDIYIN